MRLVQRRVLRRCRVLRIANPISKLWKKEVAFEAASFIANVFIETWNSFAPMRTEMFVGDPRVKETAPLGAEHWCRS